MLATGSNWPDLLQRPLRGLKQVRVFTLSFCSKSEVSFMEAPSNLLKSLQLSLMTLKDDVTLVNTSH